MLVRRLADRVLCTLPFEVDWYQARGVAAEYVGHPYFDELRAQRLDESFLAAQNERPGTIVGLLLHSQFPMFVAWGTDLGFLYNDPYADILGAKHPAALGARGVSARVASHTGFEVLSRRIEFYGRCGACRRAGAPTQRRKPWQVEASRAARVSRT